MFNIDPQYQIMDILYKSKWNDHLLTLHLSIDTKDAIKQQ
jgi:hypothetical protein